MSSSIEFRDSGFRILHWMSGTHEPSSQCLHEGIQQARGGHLLPILPLHPVNQIHML